MTGFVDTFTEDSSDNEFGSVWLQQVDPQSVTPRLARGWLGRKSYILNVDQSSDLTEGDVVDVSIGDNGNPVAGAKIGHSPSLPVDTRYPLDAFEATVEGAGFQLGAAGLDAYPPAIVQQQTGDAAPRPPGRELVYGTVGGLPIRTTVWYGRQCYAPYRLRARVLLVSVAAPDPAPMHLDLLQEFGPPADGAVTVLATITFPTITYRHGFTYRYLLPSPWIYAIGEGRAGAIRFAPADTTPGLSRLDYGAYGSLTLTADYNADTSEGTGGLLNA